MYMFVKENISFHSMIDISLQILLILFLQDTLSFLYNVKKDILSGFHLNIQVYAKSWYKFWKTFGFAKHDKF